MLNIGDESTNGINYARQLSASGCYYNSFDVYIATFNKWPHIKALYEPEFRVVMIRLNEILDAAGKIHDIFNNFSAATEAFPDNAFLLNELGKYLFKLGYYRESWCNFQKAIELDIGSVNAEKNLNSVKNLLVERWHFRMLNDSIRNNAYHDAIVKTIVPFKDSVLDIGTGTGILSMYASECSPVSLVACDGSEVMVEISESCIMENKLSGIQLMNKMSTDLTSADIGGRKSIIITELFDAGLFGEHILQTLDHAWDHLLMKNGKIIPNKAEFFVVGADCNLLKMKYQLGTYAKEILNIPSSQPVHVFTLEEAYDCEDVHLIKDIKYLTEPESVVKIDFNNFFDVKKNLMRKKPFNVDFKVIDTGEINVVIGWFNLYLTDEITLTTNPRSDARANAWQQALFFDNVPVQVNKNDVLNVKFLMNNGKLTMLPYTDISIFRMSPESLRFLNDVEYIKIIKESIAMVSVYLGQMAEISEINIVDLCPFPLFGLLMLMRGIQNLVCNPKTSVDKIFFEEVFKLNNIPLSKITFLEGDDWTQDVFQDDKYHAIFSNIFDICGDIDIRKKDIAHHLKHAHLLPGGLFMPSNIKLIAQLVDSNWLEINNKVYDVNICNYKIAKYMNKCQVSQNFCIDFNHLEYKPMTDSYVVGDFTNSMGSEILNVLVACNGEVNSILCWYNIELLEHMGKITTKRSNCFIDGMAYMVNPKLPVLYRSVANILRFVDNDGIFKLMTDTESYH